MMLAEPLDTAVNAGGTTALFVQPESRRRTYAVVAGLTLAAVALGAGVKLVRTAFAAPVAIDDHPKLEIVSNHERMLLLAVEENQNPKPDKLREALAYYVRLGVLYLEQRRFDEAERFFDELQKRTGAPRQYTILGYLGTAIALSFLDDSESIAKATRMFSELRTKFPNYSGLLGGQLPPEEAINLRYWLARALDRLAGPNVR